MILHDFQRGRLPYFNPPPKSNYENLIDGNNDTTVNSLEEDKNSSVSNLPSVKQDLEGLLVAPEFEGDDLEKSDINKSVKLVDETQDAEDKMVETDISDEDFCSDDEHENKQTVQTQSNQKFASKESNLEHSALTDDVSNEEELIDKNLINNLTNEEKMFLGFKENRSK